MAHTLADLEAMRDALQRARYAGVRSVRTDTEEISYASDVEMRTALADLERRIFEMRGTPKVTTVRLTVSKGLRTMRNFIQPGNVIGVAAPAGGVSSGDDVQIGALFGVASTTQAAGETVELAVSGVYESKKMIVKCAGEARQWMLAQQARTKRR